MGNINWSRIGQILGSPAAQNIMGVAGAGISAYAGNNQQQQNARQQAAQFAAQMAAQYGNQLEGNRQNAAVAAASASPLGANENFANQQALRLAVLSQLRNPSVTAGDPGVAAAMPKITPAFSLPQGGLSKETLAHLSPQATAGAIAQRQQHISSIDPYAPGVNFGRMGFSSDVAGGVQRETDAFQAGARGRFDAQQADQRAQIQAALQQSYANSEPEKKKGGGFLGGLGSILKVAAPIAGTFIGGPALGAAIGGIGSAVGSKLQGNSLGSSIRSGIGGAIGAGVGNAAIPAGAGRGTQALSGVNAASQWMQPQVRQAPGVDPNLLAAALRRQQFPSR